MTDKTPSFKHATLDDWQKAAQKSAPGGDVAALNWLTPDGITVKPLYTAQDIKNLPYTDTLPGFEPFLRGPQATMYAALDHPPVRRFFYRRGVQRFLSQGAGGRRAGRFRGV